MSTRTWSNPGRGLLIGLIAGLLGLDAVAVEEAAYGTQAEDVAATARAKRVELEEYLESLHRQLKQQLDEELKQRPAATIEFALSEQIPSRG